MPKTSYYLNKYQEQENQFTHDFNRIENNYEKHSIPSSKQNLYSSKFSSNRVSSLRKPKARLPWDTSSTISSEPIKKLSTTTTRNEIRSLRNKVPMFVDDEPTQQYKRPLSNVNKYTQEKKPSSLYDDAIRSYVRNQPKQQQETHHQVSNGYSKRLISVQKIVKEKAKSEKLTALSLLKKRINYEMLKGSTSQQEHIIQEKPQQQPRPKSSQTTLQRLNERHVKIVKNTQQQHHERPKSHPIETQPVKKPEIYETSNEQSEKEHPDEPLNLVECPICSRFFADHRIEVHKRACQKASKKRKQFNVQNQRLTREAKQALISTKKRATPAHTKKPATAMPKWKLQHLQFQQMLKSNKNNSTTNDYVEEKILDDRVECPHCGRKFSHETAKRHIPQCKNIKHKPTTLMKGTGMAAGRTMRVLNQNKKSTNSSVYSRRPVR